MTIDVLEADLGPGVRAGFTRRTGGASTGRYRGLDLAQHVGDDPAAVRANRELLTRWMGREVAFATQVHGCDVLVVADSIEPRAVPGRDGAEFPENRPPDVPAEADGVVSSSGHAVGVLVADCVPVLLADAGAGVVGAAHAGRRGLLAGVLQATLDRMVQLGARPARTRAALGPAAGGCCYEVPASMQQEAVAAIGPLAASTRWGTPSLDLRAGCGAVLEEAGIGKVQLVGGCTIEDPDWYSYRRDGTTGRFAGAVGMT